MQNTQNIKKPMISGMPMPGVVIPEMPGMQGMPIPGMMPGMMQGIQGMPMQIPGMMPGMSMPGMTGMQPFQIMNPQNPNSATMGLFPMMQNMPGLALQNSMNK